ncbi:hypothetical protein ACLBWT_09425 [Paenibacillus sp. D51F]
MRRHRRGLAVPAAPPARETKRVPHGRRSPERWCRRNVMGINAASFLVSAVCILLIRKGVVRPTRADQACSGGFGIAMPKSHRRIEMLQAAG